MELLVCLSTCSERSFAWFGLHTSWVCPGVWYCLWNHGLHLLYLVQFDTEQFAQRTASPECWRSTKDYYHQHEWQVRWLRSLPLSLLLSPGERRNCNLCHLGGEKTASQRTGELKQVTVVWIELHILGNTEKSLTTTLLSTAKFAVFQHFK